MCLPADSVRLQGLPSSSQGHCLQVGLLLNPPASLTTPAYACLQIVSDYNADANVHGILVQLPLPNHISEKKVLDAISLDKDVDGFHPFNIGCLAMRGREPGFVSCTPKVTAHVPCGTVLLSSCCAKAGKD